MGKHYLHSHLVDQLIRASQAGLTVEQVQTMPIGDLCRILDAQPGRGLSEQPKEEGDD